MTDFSDQKRLLRLLKLTKIVESDTQVSASLLAQRASCLFDLGETRSSRRDIHCALKFDPSHVDVLVAATKIVSPAFLKNVLSCPHATRKHRLSAVRHVSVDSVPSVHTCLFDTSLRVTLIWPEKSDVAITGALPTDHFEILCRSEREGISLLTADYVLSREQSADRTVIITCGGKTFSVQVARKSFMSDRKFELATPTCLELWIIVPVFNGAKTLKDCLTSLDRELRSTPNVRALVIDDASSDPEITRILAKTALDPRISVRQNDSNLGFVATVNKAFASVGSGPVLLLNSDTYLPPGTLKRLLYHIKDPLIATVTPLSNNAGSVTVPTPNVAFEAPRTQQSNALSRRAATLFEGQSVDVLNGNGFCMLISAEARAAVGNLSPAYIQGYYEEVDFCLRAAQKGFRHVAAVDCFVPHIGSVSFRDRKNHLVARNQKELYRRFPFYPAAYQRYKAIDPLAPYRAALMERTGWQPVKIQDTMEAAPRIDFSKLDRPLVVLGPDLNQTEVNHSDLAEHFPQFRLCPKSWASEFLGESCRTLSSLHRINDRFELIDSDGTVLEVFHDTPDKA